MPRSSEPAEKEKRVFRSPLARFRARRTNSAPPRYRQRKGTLLNEHFRVDPVQRVVLPGAPKQDADLAAHDLFNLVVLIPVIILNIMNWDWDKLLSTTSIRGIADAWTDEWFLTFYFYAQSYFFADLLWIVFEPSCVKSPATIIQHHITTTLYMLIPWFYPELRFFMGALMSVEVNTWFLIARRVFNKQGFPCWTIDIPFFYSFRIKLISILFYLTWITIRCTLYPWLLIDFMKRWYEGYQENKEVFNIFLLIIPLHCCFVILNLKWSYELLRSKIRYWRRTNKNEEEKVSKGL
mmetsp:Transcript_255/g.377  ORF Transcript_255/g.377 Transcript_255/m.377 type:complete len:294 (+) Transcript_255:174-1055(+)